MIVTAEPNRLYWWSIILFLVDQLFYRRESRALMNHVKLVSAVGLCARTCPEDYSPQHLCMGLLSSVVQCIRVMYLWYTSGCGTCPRTIMQWYQCRPSDPNQDNVVLLVYIYCMVSTYVMGLLCEASAVYLLMQSMVHIDVGNSVCISPDEWIWWQCLKAKNVSEMWCSGEFRWIYMFIQDLSEDCSKCVSICN